MIVRLAIFPSWLCHHHYRHHHHHHHHHQSLIDDQSMGQAPYMVFATSFLQLSHAEGWEFEFQLSVTNDL